YDRPLSVGRGNVVARLATSCVPSLPPTRRNAVSPSYASPSSANESVLNERPGSIVSNASPMTTSLPPWCPTPDACVATHTPPGTGASATGRVPTPRAALSARVVVSILTSRRPNSSATQRLSSVSASAEGLSPTGMVARTASVVGSTSATVPSSALGAHQAPQ